MAGGEGSRHDKLKLSRDERVVKRSACAWCSSWTDGGRGETRNGENTGQLEKREKDPGERETNGKDVRAKRHYGSRWNLEILIK
jgi:hypothetical protein